MFALGRILPRLLEVDALVTSNKVPRAIGYCTSSLTHNLLSTNEFQQFLKAKK